jgi:hypothetical protein
VLFVRAIAQVIVFDRKVVLIQYFDGATVRTFMA